MGWKRGKAPLVALACPGWGGREGKGKGKGKRGVWTYAVLAGNIKMPQDFLGDGESVLMDCIFGFLGVSVYIHIYV